MINFEKFAEILDELIFETQLQQKDFAKIVGISQSKVCNYLKGKVLPSPNSLIKIADYFECTTDYLLGLEDEMYKCTPRQLPEFKDRLRFLLKHFGYSGYKFCKDATQIHPTCYYDWLKGTSPNIESIVKIADFFHCSVDFVLGRSDIE